MDKYTTRDGGETVAGPEDESKHYMKIIAPNSRHRAAERETAIAPQPTMRQCAADTHATTADGAVEERSLLDGLLDRAGFNTLADVPSPQAVMRVVRKLTVSLREVDPLTAHAAGLEATARLTELGFMGAKGMVDRALKLSGIERGLAPAQGQAISLNDSEAWPEPVDGADLLDRLSSEFTRYVALLTPRHADALALWTLLTYVLDAFVVSPLLAITSPEKRCGKTTVLLLLGALARRAMFTSNVTVDVLVGGGQIADFRPL